MIKRYHLPVVLLLDAVVINLAFVLALLIHFEGIIPPGHGWDLFWSAMLSTGVRIVAIAGYGLYRWSWRYADLDSALRMAMAIISSSVLIGFILFAYFMYGELILGLSHIYYPGPSLIIETLLCLLFLITGRFSYRILQNIQKEQYKGKRVLIVGAGEAGEILAHEMIDRPALGYKPVGFVDDHRAMQGLRIHSIPVIGTIKDIPSLVKETEVDVMAIAIPSMGKNRSREIYDICHKAGVEIKILPRVENPTDNFIKLSRLREVQPQDLLLREEARVDIKEIASYLTGKTILVTGAGGSIGSELCRQVAMFGPARLFLLGRGENSIFQIMNELSDSHPHLALFPIIADIRDANKVDQVMRRYRPDIIFHAAAHKHVPLMELNPEEAIKNNVIGTKNLADAAVKYGVTQFVMTSSDKAVNPTNIMGASKRIGELILQSRQGETRFMSVRFGNVLGSRGSVVPSFKKQIAAGGPITVTHPEITRYFMTISEAVQLVIQAGAMAQDSRIFVLDMGEPVKIVDLARDLIRLAGMEPEIDIKIEFTGLRPGEKLYEELLTASEDLKTTKHHKILIAQPDVVNRDKLEKDINILRYLAGRMMTEPLVTKVSEMVPEYRPSRKHHDLEAFEKEAFEKPALAA